jgi:hypothetical protein
MATQEEREGILIWFPGIYHGRSDGQYGLKATDVPIDEIIELVQQRAQDDGEWSIDNGFVGPNNESEPKMRRMMAFVADEKNIRQCVEHIRAGNSPENATVDWVCRDLANASKVMVR